MTEPEPRPHRQPTRRALPGLRTWLAAGACLHVAAVMAAIDGKASRFYEDALERYERRDLPGAIIQLKNALQIDSTLLPVQLLLGRTLLGNGEAAAAEVAFQQALKLGVNRAEVVLPLAQALIAQGKQRLVLEQPNFAVAGLPPAVQQQLLLLRSSAAADLGDTRGAMKAVDDARAIDSAVVAVWLAEVPLRIRNREFREAAAAAERALALAPESAEARYQRATLFHVTGRLDAALAGYDRALAADPAHGEARVARAGIAIDLGRTADAARDVAELQRLAPQEPRGAYLAALLADRAGNADAARSALQRVTALIDPAPLDFVRYRPQWLMLNGLAHFGLGEREKAKPYLEILQRLQPNSAVTKLLAQILISEANVTRAIDVLDAYTRANPGDGQALTLLASAHMKQGRHAKAAALMQDALRHRDTPEFRTTLGLSLLGAGHATDAVAELETVLKKDPSQAPAAATLAAVYLRRQQPSRALALADDLVRQQPDNPHFHNLQGLARSAGGNAAGARVAFQNALRLNADLLPVRLNLARLEITTQAYDAAAARLAELNKAHQRNADVMFELAVLAERRGQPADAQRWLEKAGDHESPRQLRSALALVDFHLRRGAATPALDAARRLLAKSPEDISALLAYSRAQLATGDAIGARTTLGTATRVAEFDTPLQLQVATLQLAAGNADGAAYSLGKALSSEPDSIAALALLSDVEVRRGDWLRAETHARRVVALAPRRALGHGLLGDVALARGQGAAAIAAFKQAHATEPSSLTLLRLFDAIAGVDGGRGSRALAETWLQSHPGDVAVLRALADGYARSGQFGNARVRYEALLKLAPADASALNNYANVLLQQKDPLALQAAERAVAANPQSADAIDTLGWILFHHGEQDRALQTLRDARLRSPDNPDIRYHLAAVLTHLGRTAAARQEVQAALAANRRFTTRSDAEQLLAKLR